MPLTRSVHSRSLGELATCAGRTALCDGLENPSCHIRLVLFVDAEMFRVLFYHRNA